MPKQPKRPRDVSQLAKRVVDLSVGDATDGDGLTETPASRRGKARAAKLSPERRSAIAKKAATARWAKGK